MQGSLSGCLFLSHSQILMVHLNYVFTYKSLYYNSGETEHFKVNDYTSMGDHSDLIVFASLFNKNYSLCSSLKRVTKTLDMLSL